MRRLVTTAVLAIVAAAVSAAPALGQGTADLVVYGRVWTGDSAHPWAQAVAVRGDTIVAVGTRAQVHRLVGRGTRVLDNGANLVTPGFGDAHTHFLDGGFELASIDLRLAASPAEFIRRLRDYAKTLPPGQWILGGDWDHERWAGSPLPRHEWIDSITPNNPVFIARLDGHMALANALAMRAAGVTKETQAPAGGMIVRDSATGEPTGVFKDNAQGLVDHAIPSPSAEQADSALQRAMRHAASLGVTNVTTMTDWPELATWKRARTRDAMITRGRVCVQIPGWRMLADTVRVDGTGDAWLTWGCLKGFMDGSLGSRTAAFFEPYKDDSTTRGLLVTDSALRLQQVISADSAGLQVANHAIGDRANAMILSIYQAAIEKNGPRDRRFRVEHAQHLRQQDIPLFGRLGVIPSVQPYHIIDDGRWAAHRLDTARLRGTYPFRTLLDTGAHLAFGSDWTVATLDPIWGIYAAVTRRTLDDKNPGGWFPAEKITLQEALRAYTWGVAYAGFQESRIGTLRRGYLADIVLLDHDLFRMRPEALSQAKVRTTVVGGRIVYQAPRRSPKSR